MYALPFVLSMLNTSIAEESKTDNKVRLGICGGGLTTMPYHHYTVRPSR